MSERDESKLKKEFKERDVNRLRNLITKKYGESTTNQVGYTKIEEFHKEGDIWEEDGKKWTIQNGIKQTYSKLNKLKDAIRIPFICPCCKIPMNHKLDPIMYNLHKICFTCVVKTESKMKLEGTYDQYAKNMVQDNMKSFIDEAKGFITAFTEEKDDIYTEHGDKQNFVGGFDRKAVAEKWLKELDEFEQSINSNLNTDDSLE